MVLSRLIFNIVKRTRLAGAHLRRHTQNSAVQIVLIDNGAKFA
jgi:hypothetical protein